MWTNGGALFAKVILRCQSPSTVVRKNPIVRKGTGTLHTLATQRGLTMSDFSATAHNPFDETRPYLLSLYMALVGYSVGRAASNQ